MSQWATALRVAATYTVLPSGVTARAHGAAPTWMAWRPAGASAANISSMSGCASLAGVRVGPGAMAFTRTPRGPYPAAHALVSSSIAARLAPYMASPGCPKLATMVEVLTMAPQPRSAIAGTRAATRKNGTLTLTVNVSSNSSSLAESEGPPQCHAGVVDQDVDVAVARRDGPPGQLANRRHVAQRRLAVGGAAAGLLHLGGEIGGPLLVAPGDEQRARRGRRGPGP